MDSFNTPSQCGAPASSFMRQPSRGRDQLQNWQLIAQAARGIAASHNGIRATRSEFEARLKEGGFLLLNKPHPFKIYNVPAVCIPDNDIDSDWLTFRVRAGMIGDLVVDGTDGVDDPDSDEVPLDTGDITATSGVDQFFFWIELSDPSSVKTATIMFGDPNTNGWTDYPNTDGRFILIAWVDTTDTTNRQGKVRQLLRSDILMGIETTDCGTGGDSIVDYFGYRFDPPP